MKTAEEILKSKLTVELAIRNNSDYTYNKILEAMEEYASLKEDKSLKDKIFEVANELAVLGYGNEAVRLHQIHNTLPSPPKEDKK